MNRRDYLKHLGFYQSTPLTMSSKQDVIDDMNEVIAQFDGWEFRKGDPNHKCPYCIGGDEPCAPAVDRFVKGGQTVFHYNFKYNSSWDALMPVVEKIESLENRRFGVCIDVLDTMIMDYKVGHDQGERIVIQTDIYPDNGDTKRSITHEAVYQFIQWYNKNKDNGSVDSSASTQGA